MIMNTLLRGVGSGFGRVLGRFIGTIFIGFSIYVLLNALDIDIIGIIKNISLKGLIL